MSDFENPVEPVEQAAPVVKPSGKLYLKLPSEDSAEFGKVRAILQMFPGEQNVVLYFADTGVRRGTRCNLADRMLIELKNVLGEGNVVIK